MFDPYWCKAWFLQADLNKWMLAPSRRFRAEQESEAWHDRSWHGKRTESRSSSRAERLSTGSACLKLTGIAQVASQERSPQFFVSDKPSPLSSLFSVTWL